MIKENVLEIKKLVSDLHCMGTYGMVELELTKIENYVNELEGNVKNLTIPRVIAMLPSDDEIEANGIEGGLRDGELQLFWEGGTWLKNHLLKLLKPKGN